jgi:hypothetical protein
MTSQRGTLQKIVIDLAPDAWHGHASETVWAESLGDSRFRIRSVPFFACGLSVEDVVSTQVRDGVHLVTGVIVHGGHSTYRVFLGAGIAPDDSVFEERWEFLRSLGCTYERATERLFAVDVPPEADIHVVYRVLEAGETTGVWSFEEGHCGHPI